MREFRADKGSAHSAPWLLSLKALSLARWLSNKRLMLHKNAATSAID